LLDASVHPVDKLLRTRLQLRGSVGDASVHPVDKLSRVRLQLRGPVG